MTTVCDAGVYEQGVWLLRASATLLLAALIGRTGLNKVSVQKSVEMTRVNAEAIPEAQVVNPAPPTAPPTVPAVDETQSTTTPAVQTGAALMRRRIPPQPIGAAQHPPVILNGVALQRKTPTAPAATLRAPPSAAPAGSARGAGVDSGTPLHIQIDQNTLKNLRFTL